MKLAVTVTKIQQISYDEFKDFYFTKVFEDTATIKEINDWIEDTTNKGNDILASRLSEFIDNKPLK